MESSQADVTALLAELARGNAEAGEKLVPLVYQELKYLARSCLRRERPNHTLQTTALVHEAYLRLVCQRGASWRSRAEFFGIAALLMRRILIDHARAHLRRKRGGVKETLPLDGAVAFSEERSEDLVRLDEALGRLAIIDPRQSRIVELRFFGGLSVQQTSALLNISPSTVKRDWIVAKAWLHSELRHRDGDVARTVGSR
jgi:RNA polymerase sigma-70 factor (ECF subfamily)